MGSVLIRLIRPIRVPPAPSRTVTRLKTLNPVEDAFRLADGEREPAQAVAGEGVCAAEVEDDFGVAREDARQVARERVEVLAVRGAVGQLHVERRADFEERV